MVYKSCNYTFRLNFLLNFWSTRRFQDTVPYVQFSSFRYPMRIRYVSVEKP